MGKKTKLGKTRLDKFYHLAKEQGFRSRASFKLVQLNKKYDLLSKAKAVLDLCAAPGSWAQVAAKYMPVSSMIIAVDLVPIKPIKNVICLQEDITTDKCKAAIKHHLQTWKVDLVLNDGAPNVGGAWSKDAYSQSELTLYSLKLATHFLAPGGNFVTKVFRSTDYNALLWVFNQFFKRVEATKPQASRNESAEIFVVCFGYLAPKKIDPKLLDPKHVFADLDIATKKPNVMHKSVAKKNRDGYEEGATMLYKEISAADFAKCEEPLDVLTDHNKIVFEKTEEDQIISSHEATNMEILECCKDLRVLGKREFRNLMRWRDVIRIIIGVEKLEDEEKGEKGDDEEVEDEETKVSKELDTLKKQALAREKRKRRKMREKSAKYQRRIDLKMDDPNDVLETQEEQGLFTVNKIRSKRELDNLEDGTEQADAFYDTSEDEVVEEEVESSSDEDDLEGLIKRREKTEAEMDALYEDYLTRSGTEKKKESKGKKVKAISQDQVFFGGDIVEGSFKPEMHNDPLLDSDEDEEVEADHPLLDTLEEKEVVDNTDSDRKAAMLWFDQPIFKELDWRSAGGEKGGAKRAPKAEGPPPAPKGKKRPLEDNQENAVGAGRGGKKDEDEGFEIVKADSSGTDSDSDYSEDEGDEAELAVLGNLLKKKKLRKEDLIDACYHRYSFNDQDQAPRWFQDAEKKFNRRQMPITKEQVEEMKRRSKEIAARPIKKVAEAKARKKIKAVRMQQKLHSKGDAITQDTDMDDKAKMKALQKLYDKGVAVKRPKSVTVVAKKNSKSVGGGKGKGVKVVDKRMKKDMKSNTRTGTRNMKRGKAGKLQRKNAPPKPKIKKK